MTRALAIAGILAGCGNAPAPVANLAGPVPSFPPPRVAIGDDTGGMPALAHDGSAIVYLAAEGQVITW